MRRYTLDLQYGGEDWPGHSTSAPDCSTCRHLMDDDFAPDWCLLQQKFCSEERAEGDCGKEGLLHQPKDGEPHER